MTQDKGQGPDAPPAEEEVFEDEIPLQGATGAFELPKGIGSGPLPEPTSQDSPAGGMDAVVGTLQRTARDMGLVRGALTLTRLNQPGGFDCPGCAWLQPHKSGVGEFCEAGVRAVADEAAPQRVDGSVFERFSIAQLAQRSDQWLHAQGRLTQPMLRREGATHFEPVAWEEALGIIAAELNALPSPDQAVFYASGRSSNEAAFLYQLFAREYGTNNLPGCSNLCHEASDIALQEALGSERATVQIDDFAQADAVWIVGHNPGNNHPRMLATLQAAARRGCKIVSINPLREPGLTRFLNPREIFNLFGEGEPLASHFVQPRVGGDVALLTGVMKALLELEADRPGEVIDRSFIEEHTQGYERIAEGLRAESWSRIEAGSGVREPEIRELATSYAESEAVIVSWGTGLTQHAHGVAAVQAVVNLLLLRGNVGRPGAGLFPARGHSNIQGCRSMGLRERAAPEWLDRLGAQLEIEPPRQPGHSAIEAIAAMANGAAQVFVSLGGNLAAAAPDTQATLAAFERCRLTAHIATRLNRSHVTVGRRAVLLPCLGRSERDLQAAGPQMITTEDAAGVVRRSRGAANPASPQLRSEPAIVAGLAAATLGQSSRIRWDALVEDYDRIRELIASVVPGFEDFNARVRSGPIVLPSPARERHFDTETGRARFATTELPTDPLKPGQLMMMTLRSQDQFNTVVYGPDDRLRGIKGERRVVMLNPEDMAERSLERGQIVDLVSHFRGERRTAPGFIAVPYELPRGCAATYFPEANALVPAGSYDRRSLTPSAKSVVVTVHPA